MEYRFAPIYKYLVILVIFFLFLSYYKNITSEKYLPIVLIFVLVNYIVDHMTILNHPILTHDIKENIQNKEETSIKYEDDEDVELIENDEFDDDTEDLVETKSNKSSKSKNKQIK